MKRPERASGRTCTNKTLLYLFIGLCIAMLCSAFLYWHYVNEVLSLTVVLADTVKNIYTDGTSLLLDTLRLNKTESNHGPTTRRPGSGNVTTLGKVPTTKKRTEAPPRPPTDRPDNCEVCFKHDFNYVLDNDQICARNDKSPEIDVVILIFTVHQNRLQRDTIRNTWLTYAKNNSLDSNIRYAFLLGATSDSNMNKKVKEEFDVFKDILKEDFKDAYSNLTYKTMMAYKWASTKCKDAKFVMKTDDDMYVNIPNILKTLNTNKDKLQTHVGGACHQVAQPIRDHRSKWYASKRSFPGSHYPGFCSGTGYVTSMNVATKVFEVSKHVPFFHLEDVYVAICIKKLGYKLLSIPNFNAGRFAADPCIYQGNSMMTSHQVPPDMMKKMWFGKCKKNA
ncbi:beta-1,3-galactosyltransferase 1-like [Mizuhopecten yessoensis]|uniref:Hexosyltransferase n=1 Tax=Mizuhopecten yessoensis TaxID=6573 RepID=A0A210PU72_MIZYE|nr:beta-1,3-galactosyltransferase 1-like [Mizuhopecten yessoensis]OWF40049.1 Beta-1,3-galactosyltransferase 1 [Mizuhopecten yessoensis]